MKLQSKETALGARRWATSATFFSTGLVQSAWFARISSVGSVLSLRVEDYWTLITAFSLGAVLGLALASPLSRRLGNRRALLLSAVMLGPCEVLIALLAESTHSLAATIPALFAFAISYAVLDVSMNVDGAAVENAAGRNLMPGFHAFFSTGAFVGALLALGAVWAGLGPLPNFVLSSAIGLGIVTFAKFRPKVRVAERPAVDLPNAEPGTLQSERPRNGVLSIMLQPLILCFAVVAFCFLSAEGTAVNLITLATEQGHQRTASEGSAAYAIFMTSMTATRFLGGRIADRLGRRPTLAVAALTGLAGVLLFVVGNQPVLTVGAWLWGMGCAVGFPLAISLAAAGESATAPLRVSAMAVAGYGAMFVTPPAIDFLAGAWGILPSLLVLVGFFVIAGLAVLLSRRVQAVETKIQSRGVLDSETVRSSSEPTT